MKALGIIAEYNPFHNGHLYQILKAKKDNPEHVFICVLNGNYTQRGEPAILNKYIRAKWALDNGIDIVLELPFIYGVQRADIFSESSIFILNEFGIDKLVYGVEYYNYGNSNLESLPPNNKLEYFYKKSIKKNLYKIHTYHILRKKTKYNQEYINSKYFASATAIRKLIFEKNIDKNINVLKYYMPLNVLSDIKEYYKFLVSIDDYYQYIKYKLILGNNYENIAMNRDGLLNNLKKNIFITENYKDFFDKSHKKHISKTHLQRLLTFFLCNITSQTLKNDTKNEYTRILAINKKGIKYLSQKKKKINIKIEKKILTKKYISEYNSELFYNLLTENKYFYKRKIVVR